MSLINIPESSAQNILVKMELASFQFHLTGSQFFGNAKPDSDWDFFAEDQPGLEDWLEANGFFVESGSGYDSVDILKIWQHESGKIHVQIVKDARLKSAVQNALYHSGHAYAWLHRLSKDDRKRLWNIAIDLFQMGGKEAIRAMRRANLATMISGS